MNELKLLGYFWRQNKQAKGEQQWLETETEIIGRKTRDKAVKYFVH